MSLASLIPLRVLAADASRFAFTATTLADAFKASGVTPSADSALIVIKAPEVAENGAQVPIEIISNIPGSRQAMIFIDKNPLPLTAHLFFVNGTLPHVRLQVKMAESSRLRLVIKAADGKTYHASREIKVTIGGCGA
ncbi:thiosulfate oxidation carrier protein SoxY [Accumulibacter sp.]|nr:thiosulfate oxidation carrier protein SoxY [Accumulibacter sp.]MDS4055710.1 thiosulfate oxidation carrier protein SoxY [Accumulibacter sp.]